MSQWFRMYDDTINNAKVQRLPAELFKAWVNLLCLASQNGGVIPAIDDVAFALRVDSKKAAKYIKELVAAGLIDEDSCGDRPHNWSERQYKSDTSTSRMRAHRERARAVSSDGNVTSHVTVGDAKSDALDTDTDTERKKDSDTNVSGESSPSVDFKKVIFDQGLKFIANGSGKPESGLRPLVGKWVSLYGEAKVAGAIIDAQRVSAIDPIGYIQGIFARGSPAKATARPLSAMNYRAGTEGFDVT